MADDAARRLSDLLREPRETLDIELKGWLDLAGNEEHKALLAKAMIAMANHGGGVVIIGFEDSPRGCVPAVGRPGDLSSFSPDLVNAAINRYAEPPFHCDPQLVRSPVDGELYPVIVIPGGHRFPVRAKRSGPNGGTIAQNTYYIRRPGPQSQAPQSGQEWDELLRRCLANGRDELLNAFRLLMAGGAPIEAAAESEINQVERWFATSFDRWREKTETLAPDHPVRLLQGGYTVGYALFSDRLIAPPIRELLDRMRAGVVRHTGWAPFWVPTRAGIAPYPYENHVECWLADGEDRDPAHADFWRASPDGKFFLVRGYDEDGTFRPDHVTPGQTFDALLPVWRMGEVLLHAASMARQMDVPDARVVMLVEWRGLVGRLLVRHGRHLSYDRFSRQDVFRNSVTAQADQIGETLPELVDRLTRPLFELFDFYSPPTDFAAHELARLRSNQF